MTLEEWKRLHPGKGINEYYANQQPVDEPESGSLNAAYAKGETAKMKPAPFGIYYIPMQHTLMEACFKPEGISRLRSGFCPFGSGKPVRGKEYLLVGVHREIRREQVYLNGEELTKIVYQSLGAYVPYNATGWGELTKNRFQDFSKILVTAGLVVGALISIGIILVGLLYAAGLNIGSNVSNWLLIIFVISFITMTGLSFFISNDFGKWFGQLIKLPADDGNWKYGFQQSSSGYPKSVSQEELTTLLRQGKLIRGSRNWLQ